MGLSSNILWHQTDIDGFRDVLNVMIMNKVLGAVFAFALVLGCCGQSAWGQTSFKMTKENGHYYTTATINGKADIPVFIETGYPALTVSLDRYDELLASLPLEEIELEQVEWLRGDRAKHRIHKKLKGKVPVGDLVFEGFVYVVDPYDDRVTVPANLLKSEADTTVCLIRFDFKKNTLDYIRRDAADLTKMHTYRLVEFDPMPIFVSTMELSDASGHDLEITGNFNFDLGCGSSVFFFRNTMLPVLKENKFKIQTATDRAGNVIGHGIFAGYCKIGDKSKTGFSIGITNKTFWEDDQLGCVGPSFFQNGTVILDPANDLIYYR